MAKAQVAISLDTAGLVAQLTALRLLCSQMGFALDTAILKLTDPCDITPPESGSDLHQYDGPGGAA